MAKLIPLVNISAVCHARAQASEPWQANHRQRGWTTCSLGGGEGIHSRRKSNAHNGKELVQQAFVVPQKIRAGHRPAAVMEHASQAGDATKRMGSR